MDFPRTIYAIYPKDEQGNIVGVYVGSTSRPLEKRIRGHLCCASECPKQKMLHELMKKNGYILQKLEVFNKFQDRHLEYDWVDYFIKKTDLEIFNTTMMTNQNYKNCCFGRVGEPK